MKKHHLAPLLLCTALVVAGCSGGDDGSAAGGATPPAAPTTPSTPTEPESSAPAVPPATGTRLALPSAAVRVPDDDWVTEAADTGAGGAYLLDGSGGLTLLEVPTLTDDPDLDHLVELTLDNAKADNPFPMRLGEPREVDGVEMPLIEGGGGGKHVTILKSVVLDPAATIHFELRTTGPASLHRERLESMLATWRWR
ncbi:hypothetical protein NOK12_36550 [Nocardioides sp. OK12]|nr:hypothetical protein NOK12_36550 [Nocardioides sp. OK12]